ncbi:MAG: aminotransferase class I/II-fold pyridoxal phosphate-dependent enzyme [Desulfohalobiaceae bacterium]|nr:aminotransferase class I/II-fold pyridoxal phosphate-dependent enzyme [Desulfohalobiaceae bacterium]
MMHLSQKEQAIVEDIKELSSQAGSHSPSVLSLSEKIPDLDIKVDACFLSNPYATDLFADRLQDDLIRSGKLREVLEYYPSQNQVIAECLSRHLQVPQEKLFLGNGATEIIQAVIHNFTRRRIMINIPTFSPYYEFVQEGTEVVYNELYQDGEFRFDLEKYIRVVETEQPDTVVIINPNNPSGCYLTLSEIETLLQRLDWVENVIIDESFMHFAFEDQNYDLITATHLSERFRNLIIIKSMSKDFGIAGIRAGYAIMESGKVNDLLDNGYLWNLSGLAEYFFRLYANPEFQTEYEQVRIRYIKETQRFFKGLAHIDGLRVYPSLGNFILIELLNGWTACDFTSALLIKHGVYSRDCNDKIGLEGEFVRLASRSREENEYILQSIADILQSGDAGRQKTVQDNNLVQLSFWEKEDCDIQGMMLNPEAGKIEARDRMEVLSYLPDLAGKRILEPAAGIGRFTTHFALQAKKVVALDFVEDFIALNRNICAPFANISHQAADIMKAEFEPESFDVIFINWLLMYLEDADLPVIKKRMSQWLQPGGQLFLRESCVSASNPDEPHPHTQYRDPKVYEDLFLPEFEIVKAGRIEAYVQEYGNPNQRWWLFTK